MPKLSLSGVLQNPIKLQVFCDKLCVLKHISASLYLFSLFVKLEIQYNDPSSSNILHTVLEINRKHSWSKAIS